MDLITRRQIHTCMDLAVPPFLRPLNGCIQQGVSLPGIEESPSAGTIVDTCGQAMLMFE